MKVVPFTMLESEYFMYSEEMVGLCVKCGAERYQTEPDARRYPCDECGARAVYGVPELLQMGLVEFCGEEED